MGVTWINIKKPGDLNNVVVYFGENNEYSKNVLAFLGGPDLLHYSVNVEGSMSIVVYTDKEVTINGQTYQPYIVLDRVLTDIKYTQTIQEILVPQVIGDTTIYNTITIPVVNREFTNTVTVNQKFSSVATIVIEPDKQYEILINI